MNTLDRLLDWNLVRSFVATHDGGSLSAAARQLGSSQPTVGRQVAALEAALGVALFERTRRGLAPTDAARAIVEHARQMQRAAHALEIAASARSERLEGVVRISASEVIAAMVLPTLLARLRQAEPGIGIEVVATNAVSNLLEREADIAVRMVRPRQANVVARRLGTMPIGAYASRDYLSRRPRPRRPADLGTHELLLYADDDAIERGFRVAGIALDAARIALRTADHLVYWQALRAGLGIGFVATLIADDEPALERLALPDLPVPKLDAWLAVHRELRSSRRIRRVYDFLADALTRRLAG